MTYKDKLIDLLKSDEKVKEVMEKLEFGCKILYWDKNFPRELIIDRYHSYIECWCRKWKCALSAMTWWRCETKWCINHWTSWSSSIPKICEECSRKKNKCQFCWNYLEVISLPLQERFIRMYCENKKINIAFSNTELWHLNWDVILPIICKLDNTKDFDNQSEEVYQKIYEALNTLTK